MSTTSSEIDADLQTLFEAIAAGRKVDRATAQRIIERAEQSREEVRQTLGVQDLGVELIREARASK